jgi:hypothetical protein
MCEQSDVRFAIDSAQKAEWAIAKIRCLRAETERKAAFYRAQAESIEANAAQNEAGLTMMLERYFNSLPQDLLHSTKTFQSLRLSEGVLKLKRPSKAIERDEKVLLHWVKGATPSHVKVLESVDWAGLKNELIEKDGRYLFEGEAVPGVIITEKPAEFRVEV